MSGRPWLLPAVAAASGSGFRRGARQLDWLSAADKGFALEGLDPKGSGRVPALYTAVTGHRAGLGMPSYLRDAVLRGSLAGCCFREGDEERAEKRGAFLRAPHAHHKYLPGWLLFLLFVPEMIVPAPFLLFALPLLCRRKDRGTGGRGKCTNSGVEVEFTYHTVGPFSVQFSGF